MYNRLTQPNPSNVKVFRTLKDHRDFETSAIGIQFIITQQHFIRGKLKVRIFQFSILVVCVCLYLAVSLNWKRARHKLLPIMHCTVYAGQVDKASSV